MLLLPASHLSLRLLGSWASARHVCWSQEKEQIKYLRGKSAVGTVWPQVDTPPTIFSLMNFQHTGHHGSVHKVTQIWLHWYASQMSLCRFLSFFSTVNWQHVIFIMSQWPRSPAIKTSIGFHIYINTALIAESNLHHVVIGFALSHNNRRFFGF